MPAVGAIWAWIPPQFQAEQSFTSDQSGLDAAIVYCTPTGGVVQVGPGLESLTITGVPNGVSVFRLSTVGSLDIVGYLNLRNRGLARFKSTLNPTGTDLVISSFDDIGAVPLPVSLGNNRIFSVTEGGTATLGVAGQNQTLTVGQGTTGTDSAKLRVRSGNSGTTSPQFYLNRNGTDFVALIYDGESYLEFSTALNFHGSIGGSTMLRLTASSAVMSNNIPLRWNTFGGVQKDVLNQGTDDTVVLAASAGNKLLLRSNAGAGSEINLTAAGKLDLQNMSAGIGLSGGGVGTAGQIPVSAGAAPPVWTTVAGTPGSTMKIGLPVKIWFNTILLGATNPTFLYDSVSGVADYSNYLFFTVPSNYTTTTSWQVHWSSTSAADASGVAWKLGMFKWPAAGSTVSGSYTDGATQTDNAPGVKEQLVITTVGTPAISLVAGDQVMLRIMRLGASDASTFAANFHGVVLNYT